MHVWLLPWIGWIFTVAILAFACWKGSVAERFGILAIFVTAVEVWAIQHFVPVSIRPFLFLFTDFLLAAAFLVLAVRYASLWLGMAMMLQAAQFVLHFYYVTNELAYDRRYAVANNLITAAILLVLVTGVIATWRRSLRLSRAARTEAAGAETVSPTA